MSSSSCFTLIEDWSEFKETETLKVTDLSLSPGSITNVCREFHDLLGLILGILTFDFVSSFTIKIVF